MKLSTLVPFQQQGQSRAQPRSWLMALNFCLCHHLQASRPYSALASVGSREQRSQQKDSMSPANLEPLSKVINKKSQV